MRFKEIRLSVDAEYRLPRAVIPSHYELTLAPDLADAAFTGSEVVAVEVVEPVTEVVLNALGLDIAEVSMTDDAGRTLPAVSISYDQSRERATFTFAEELAPGAWELRAGFSGVLKDDLFGFYRSTYRDEDGSEQVIAVTQFEATDARRAFPCWDEPDLKATFAVTLVVADGLVAVSNARELSAEPTGDGRVVHRFATTMKMATYLVAFVVGDFEMTEPVDVGGIPLRVLHLPGRGHLADFALEAGAFAVEYFATYYDIPYPGDKLDLIGIPDFAWGAMENLGAVTFRESALLVDRNRATQGDLAGIADIIAHELAHMWFGDLVTMKWWNGIWLNEAFATLMEIKCVDAYRPDWKRWLSFAHSRALAMDVDGLSATRPVEYPVGSPEEANAMFDTLTYRKGSAVLRMLDVYLGEETFRRGIGRYLVENAYGNTETADLWAALEAESHEPVAEIMEGWISQGGYPQLDVSVTTRGFRLEQRQFRYLGEGHSFWQVPVLYRSEDGEGRIVVGAAAAVLAGGEDFLLNRGGDGFYRINYPAEHLQRLAARFADLAPAERYGLVADTWANVLAGEKPAEDFLALVSALDGETEPDVWGIAISGLAELGRVVSSDDRPALQRFVRNLAGPQAAALGWSPGVDESDLEKRLRGVLLRAVGNLGGDVTTQATALEVFERAVADSGSVDPDVMDAAIGIVAANGGRSEFTRFLELRACATTPLDEERYLRAAAAVPEKKTAAHLIEMILVGDIRSHDANWLLARLLGHRDTGVSVWEMVKQNWAGVQAAMPQQNRRRMLDLIMYRSEPEVAADIEAWLAAHPISGAEKFTAQQLERLRVRVGLRARESERLGQLLS